MDDVSAAWCPVAAIADALAALDADGGGAEDGR